MKIYNTQAEVEKDIKDGVLVVNEDVEFKCSLNIKAKLEVTGDIKAMDIVARDVAANDIKVWDIKVTGNIQSRNIDAHNIIARGINAIDIMAINIFAENVLYWAFCVVYNSITCVSIRGKRKNHAKPICLDGKHLMI